MCFAVPAGEEREGERGEGWLAATEHRPFLFLSSGQWLLPAAAAATAVAALYLL